MDPKEFKRASLPSPFGPRAAGYDAVPLAEQNTAYNNGRRFEEDRGHLLADASTFGRTPSHNPSFSEDRDRSHSPQPRLPDLDFGPQTTYAQPNNAPWQPQRGNAY
jgi:hypothetical protein